MKLKGTAFSMFGFWHFNNKKALKFIRHLKRNKTRTIKNYKRWQ